MEAKIARFDPSRFVFFFWGFVKDRVYQTHMADLADLLRRIVEVIALVTPEMLSRVWQEIEYHLATV